MRLSGKKAVVTGGSSGIGLAIAQAFVSEGAKVVLSGRSADALEKAVNVLGAKSSSVQANVQSIKEITQLFKSAAERLGRLDIVVANAGIADAATLEAASEEMFDEIIETNFKGTYFTVQKSLPYLNLGASIILVSSAVGQLGVPGLSIYGATKAAVRALARSFSAELTTKGIRVNTLSPGPVDTPIFTKMGVSVDDLAKHIENDIPLKRMGTPEEIGRAAVFLACDDSTFMAGSELVIDGGHSQI